MNYLILLLITAIESGTSLDLYDMDISVDGYDDPIYFERWFWICIAFVLLIALVLLSIGKIKKNVTVTEEITETVDGVIEREK